MKFTEICFIVWHTVGFCKSSVCAVKVDVFCAHQMKNPLLFTDQFAYMSFQSSIYLVIELFCFFPFKYFIEKYLLNSLK